jgi:UDP-N-acetylglucosamine acyltransferase
MSLSETGIAEALGRLAHRYPSLLIDAVRSHEPGRRLVAVKNVTVSEEFFQGHFPGTPLMPGVLLVESLTQAATLLLLDDAAWAGGPLRLAHGDRVFLRGVENAKFRRQVVPGDRLTLDVTLGRVRGPIARARGTAAVDDHIVAEADLVLGVEPAPAQVALDPAIHPTAIVHPGARIGVDTTIGPYTTIGEHVTLGARCRIGASAVVDGWTEIGDETEIFPFASIGLVPQDLKFKGEPTRLVIGRRNVFREFVTIHRGTSGGGGVTTIGDHNFFMAYAHVAHDCRIGNHVIFGNGATLGGHVHVEDFATISAYSGVHQFCRVGRHAFIGGYTVVTRDALPFAKTVGNRARIYGLNSIGLARCGFSQELIAKLRRAYRQLHQHNTSRAIREIERDQDLAVPEIAYLIEFIRTAAKRGVILRRPSGRAGDPVDGE